MSVWDFGSVLSHSFEESGRAGRPELGEEREMVRGGGDGEGEGVW